MMDLKKTLRQFRKRQGLSQIELAEALDVSRQTVSKWETGAALPSAENLLALSRLYGTPVDALLTGGMQEGVPQEESCLPLQPDASVRSWLPPLLGAVLLLDLAVFLLDFSFGRLLPGLNLSGIFCPILRMLGCAAAGLFFVRRTENRPVNWKFSLFLAAVSLAAGLYVLLLNPPLLWKLYDQTAWVGSPQEALVPSNPIFFFLGLTLFDQWALFAHLLLIFFFQLGRLWLFRKGFHPFSRPQALHHH